MVKPGGGRVGIGVEIVCSLVLLVYGYQLAVNATEPGVHLEVLAPADGAAPVGELGPVVVLVHEHGMSCAVGRWFPAPTDCGVVAPLREESAHVSGVHHLLLRVVNRLLPVAHPVHRLVELGGVVDQGVLVSESDLVVVDVHGVARSSGRSLLPQLRLGNGLLDVGVVGVVESTDNTDLALVIGLVEELGCHHHLLLEFALIRIGGLPLNNDVELIILATDSRSIGSAYPVICVLNLAQLTVGGALPVALASEVAHGTLCS